jgi:Na+/melibiose symporter-like transporter
MLRRIKQWQEENERKESESTRKAGVGCSGCLIIFIGFCVAFFAPLYRFHAVGVCLTLILILALYVGRFKYKQNVLNKELQAMKEASEDMQDIFRQ